MTGIGGHVSRGARRYDTEARRPMLWVDADTSISPEDLAEWQRRWLKIMEEQPSQLRWIPPGHEVQFTGPYEHRLGPLDPDDPVPPSYTLTTHDPRRPGTRFLPGPESVEVTYTTGGHDPDTCLTCTDRCVMCGQPNADHDQAVHDAKRHAWRPEGLLSVLPPGEGPTCPS